MLLSMSCSSWEAEIANKWIPYDTNTPDSVYACMVLIHDTGLCPQYVSLIVCLETHFPYEPSYTIV
jgi:hypothetical protein